MLKVYLENITNSRKDFVGKAQLCMMDHVSPSCGMGGKDSKSCFMPYIFLKASEKANLQAKANGKKNVYINLEREDKYITKSNPKNKWVITCSFQHL